MLSAQRLGRSLSGGYANYPDLITAYIHVSNIMYTLRIGTVMVPIKNKIMGWGHCSVSRMLV